MPFVTKETPPKCRRFTYDGFVYVVHIISTAFLPRYSCQFTLKSKYNKDEKTVSYLELTSVNNAWIKKHDDETKVCQKIIDQYVIISWTPSTYNNFFKHKKWVFGSTAVETKKNKMVYIDTHKALYVLCKNMLMSIDDAAAAADDDYTYR